VRSDGSHALDLITFSVFAPDNRATVAAPNDAWLAQRERGAVEQFQYDSGSGVIQAFAVKPPGFDAGKRYPLLADVRDAPREMCGVNFDLRTQIFAAAGFVALCANTRGAPGYGEDFGNVLETRLPGDDFDDLMRGVDFILAKGYIDARRISIAGGITAAWAIGHTDRLVAAIAIRPKAWIARPAWDDPGLFASRSPIFFGRNFRTPTLVLAGEPDPESETIYSALQSQKVKSALVRIRGVRPSEKVLELEATLAWLKN
jgi:acylaminoacyl-peptidase